MIFAIGIIVAVALLLGAVWFIIEPTSNPSKKQTTSDSEAPAQELSEITQMRRVVTDAMNEVAGGITTLMGSARTYDVALAEHRRGIEQAGSPDEIKTIEENILAELDQMRLLNQRYRDQLSAARMTIRQQQDEIEASRKEAGEDALTRIPNRRSFDGRMTEEISRVERHLEPLSILLIDIDRFKDVNDSYGHVVGDSVLQGVAHVLNDLRRQHDFLARYGGEEFCMILPKSTVEQALPVAERLREHVSKVRFKKDGHNIAVTCSIGVAQYRPGIDDEDSFIARCDAALYLAKTTGRDQVQCEEVQADT